MAYQVDWRQGALDELASLVFAIEEVNLSAAAALRYDLEHAPDPLKRTPPVVHKKSAYVQGQHEIVARPNYIVLYELDKLTMLATVTAVYHARQRR
jgi:plasmid stabilization system protein ParE